MSWCLRQPLSIAVPVGGAQHLLPEVRAVDAARALPGAAAPGLLRQRGRRGHERDLRLHGRPVSRGRRMLTRAVQKGTLFRVMWMVF